MSHLFVAGHCHRGQETPFECRVPFISFLWRCRIGCIFGPRMFALIRVNSGSLISVECDVYIFVLDFAAIGNLFRGPWNRRRGPEVQARSRLTKRILRWTKLVLFCFSFVKLLWIFFFFRLQIQGICVNGYMICASARITRSTHS